jgi:hypothetical protein
LIRRTLAACALAALLSAPALRAQDANVADANVACDAEAEARLRDAVLAKLFAVASQKSAVAANGMRVAEQGSTDVVVAHIDADGQLVLGCVDNERAARAFFAAPPAEKQQQ